MTKADNVLNILLSIKIYKSVSNLGKKDLDIEMNWTTKVHIDKILVPLENSFCYIDDCFFP